MHPHDTHCTAFQGLMMTTRTGLNSAWIMGFLATVICMTVEGGTLTLSLSDREKDIPVYYASPTGTGDQNGSSEHHALPVNRLQPFVRDLTHSARIVLLPGRYALASTLDLTAGSGDRVLVIEGRQGAVLTGYFDATTLSGVSSGLRLRSGNIIVRGLRFEKSGFCIKADKNVTIDQVLIENITAEDVHTCIMVDRDVVHPVTRWIVRDARINGYYRNGIRLAGTQTRDILIENTHIDGVGSQPKSDCHKSGIQLLAGVSDVHIRNSSVKNNVGDCGDGYQQGDGIEADHKDGTPRNIRLENVQISNSADASLDLKADNVIMQRVVSQGGPQTRFAFKLWDYRQYECSECYAFGANVAFIQLIQASLSLKSTILSNQNPVHICDLRHGSTPGQQAEVRFDDSRVYLGNEDWINECGEGVLTTVGRIPAGYVAPPHPPAL